MIGALCAGLFVVWVAGLCFRIGAALWTVHTLRSDFLPASSTQSPRLICLLPAYREQSIVDETLAVFAERLSEAPAACAVVITSLREERDRQAATVYESPSPPSAFVPTTTEVVRSTLPNLPLDRFLHLVYDGDGGGKAVHLNFALSQLRERGELSDVTYIGVYDFDSHPEQGSLAAVTLAARCAPDAIVQPVLPVLGADRASIGAVVDSVIHVLRGLGAETFVWSMWPHSYHFPNLWRAAFDPYFVGCGLFIRADRLLGAGGFPTPVDDVPLGFAAASEGWRVIPTRRVCLTECYPDLVSAVRSRTVVFHAYWEFVAAALRRRPLRLFTGTFREAVAWAASPILFLVVVSILAARGEWAVLTLGLTFLGLTAAAAVRVGHGISSRFNRKFPRLRLAMFFVSAAYPLWRALAAWNCLRAVLGAGKQHVDFSRNKTPRLAEGEPT